MKKLVVSLVCFLAACTTVPNYRLLAHQTVPTTMELVAEITNPLSEEVEVKTYCTGVAVTKKYVITAGHCIAGAMEVDSKEEKRKFLENGKIMLRFQDGSRATGTIVSHVFKDADGPVDSRDSSLLRVDDRVLTPAFLGDSDLLQQGDQVAIVGNTFGVLTYSFTIGVVSYIDRKLPVGTFIQTDALSGPGNSGGPVFNMGGELVGILVRGGGGVSLFLPINLVISHLHEAMK